MINRPFVLKTSSDRNIWFTSDWHMGHLGPRSGIPLWQSRGYNSASEMTQGIIDKLNELVKPNDYIFNCGDFCLNSSEEDFKNYLSSINCQNIHYITGNHNSRIKDAYKKVLLEKFGTLEYDVYPIRYKNIIFVGDYIELNVDGKNIVMCHYPIDIFNEMGRGTYMLCGHSHYMYQKTRADCVENRRLDLSWDGHGKPLTIDDINLIMSKKALVGFDHHGNPG